MAPSECETHCDRTQTWWEQLGHNSYQDWLDACVRHDDALEAQAEADLQHAPFAEAQMDDWESADAEQDGASFSG